MDPIVIEVLRLTLRPKKGIRTFFAFRLAVKAITGSAKKAQGKKNKATQVPAISTAAALANGASPMPAKKNAHPECVIEARYVRTSQLFLRFADGFEGTWPFSQLCLDMSDMKLTSIKASASGDSIDVKSKSGDDVELDSSSLRALIDPEYAARLEKTIASLLIPSERLERIAAKNQPPQEWYDSPEKLE